MSVANLSEDSTDLAIQRVLEQLNGVILGKAHQTRLALACLLARGHLLIEDLPGVGKTTLAHAIAQTLGLQFQRIQFTSDLLPADIVGVSIFSREDSHFEFHPGPIFAQLVLADEINRATPKTQSALLEAMEEYQVTIEGVTRPLPQPFFVIATQNPQEQVGTYPLPESQLDRFLMRIQLGYPDAASERALLRARDRRELLQVLPPCISTDTLIALQAAVTEVHVADALLDYVQAITAHTRRPGLYRNGLSPRATLSLVRAAQAWALIDRRHHVLPEDVQRVLPAVAGHRLIPVETAGAAPERVVTQLIEAVPVP